MYKYITSKKTGEQYKVDFFCVIEDGETTISIETDYFSKLHTLKVYYTEYKTWDQYMGNTPAGYYVNVPLPDGSKQRVYCN